MQDEIPFSKSFLCGFFEMKVCSEVFSKYGYITGYILKNLSQEIVKNKHFLIYLYAFQRYKCIKIPKD